MADNCAASSSNTGFKKALTAPCQWHSLTNGFFSWFHVLSHFVWVAWVLAIPQITAPPGESVTCRHVCFVWKNWLCHNFKWSFDDLPRFLSSFYKRLKPFEIVRALEVSIFGEKWRRMNWEHGFEAYPLSQDGGFLSPSYFLFLEGWGW